ncbi:MAG: FG-GAP repeat domain-containing protein [Leptolyngbya sp. IPPAS B-1204]|nr:MAG: VCBS repeat-containing protein [Leptolyngbya sp. IPPAS B-1204]
MCKAHFQPRLKTIYLFEDFLSGQIDHPQAVAAVLLEEIGHYLDAQLNPTDTPGDEGAMFAALVQNQAVNESALQILQAEDDAGLLHLNGQILEIEQSAVPLRLERQLGQQGDTIISERDFDGDRKTDMAVWNPATGNFSIRTSSSNWNTVITRQLGQQGDVALRHYDFDGDGKTDLAVWRPSTKTFLFRTSSSNWNTVFSRQLAQGDTVIEGWDFDGDRKTDLTVWNSSTSTFVVHSLVD